MPALLTLFEYDHSDGFAASSRELAALERLHRAAGAEVLHLVAAAGRIFPRDSKRSPGWPEEVPMSKPFDATLKGMVEVAPVGWPDFAGYAAAGVDVIDADVSTVTAASDKVLRVRGKPPWILDVNFQRGPDASLPRRVHLYNAILENRHDLLVRSVVILLTPEANLSAISGRYVRRFPGEKP